MILAVTFAILLIPSTAIEIGHICVMGNSLTIQPYDGSTPCLNLSSPRCLGGIAQYMGICKWERQQYGNVSESHVIYRFDRSPLTLAHSKGEGVNIDILNYYNMTYFIDGSQDSINGIALNKVAHIPYMAQSNIRWVISNVLQRPTYHTADFVSRFGIGTLRAGTSSVKFAVLAFQDTTNRLDLYEPSVVIQSIVQDVRYAYGVKFVFATLATKVSLDAYKSLVDAGVEIIVVAPLFDVTAAYSSFTQIEKNSVVVFQKTTQQTLFSFFVNVTELTQPKINISRVLLGYKESPVTINPITNITNQDPEYVRDTAFIQGIVTSLNNPVVSYTMEDMPIGWNRTSNYAPCHHGSCPLSINALRAYQYQYPQADAYFENAGSHRNGWSAGNVPMSTVYNSYPFTSPSCVVRVRGQTLWQNLNHSSFQGTAIITSRGPALAQTVGIKYGFNPFRNATRAETRLTFAKIYNKTSGQWEDIKRGRLYTVITSGYVCLLGDGYNFTSRYPGESVVLREDLEVRKLIINYMALFNFSAPLEVEKSEFVIADNSTDMLMIPRRTKDDCRFNEYFSVDELDCMPCGGFWISTENKSDCYNPCPSYDQYYDSVKGSCISCDVDGIANRVLNTCEFPCNSTSSYLDVKRLTCINCLDGQLADKSSKQCYMPCTGNSYYERAMHKCIVCSGNFIASYSSQKCISGPFPLGGIVGILVGIFVLIVIAVVISIFIWRRRQRSKNKQLLESAPKGDVAIVFTDIQGSTKLWHDMPFEMEESLDKHNELIRSTIRKYRGFEVKTIGDSFMIAFWSAKDAVMFALDVQEELLNVEWPDALSLHEACQRVNKDDGCLWNGLRVRMGIHKSQLHPTVVPNKFGVMIDYFGPPVNTAARVEGQAQGGQILFSESVQQEVCHQLDGAVIEFIGARKLKGIDGEVPLYSVLPRGLCQRTFKSETRGICPLCLEKVDCRRCLGEEGKPTLGTNLTIEYPATASHMSMQRRKSRLFDRKNSNASIINI